MCLKKENLQWNYYNIMQGFHMQDSFLPLARSNHVCPTCQWSPQKGETSTLPPSLIAQLSWNGVTGIADTSPIGGNILHPGIAPHHLPPSKHVEGQANFCKKPKQSIFPNNGINDTVFLEIYSIRWQAHQVRPLHGKNWIITLCG